MYGCCPKGTETKLRRSARRYVQRALKHLAIENMGDRHTTLPHQFDAHGLKITSFSLVHTRLLMQYVIPFTSNDIVFQSLRRPLAAQYSTPFTLDAMAYHYTYLYHTYVGRNVCFSQRRCETIHMHASERV